LAGSNVELKEITNLWHGYPSIFWDPTCNSCPKWFDGFGNIIKHLLENLKTGAVGTVNLLTDANKLDYVGNGVLRKFSQTEFSEAFIGTNINLDDYGYVWIPNACLNK